MAGPVPAIPVFFYSFKRDVEARHKAGHDVTRSCRSAYFRPMIVMARVTTAGGVL
jgi:hypothetical protein